MEYNSTYTRSNRLDSVVDFGITDQRGRALGAYVVTMELDYVPAAEGSNGYNVAPGHYFIANVMAARNGDGFGASQSSGYFTTAAERDAYVARRVAATRTRYAKQFSK